MNKKIFILTETVEGTDGIRDFQIIGIMSDRKKLQDKITALVAKDTYGYFKRNGMGIRSKDIAESNYCDCYVKYEIVSQQAEIELSDEESSAIYREKQLNFRIEDAKNHCDSYDYAFTEEEIKLIAERFLSKYDCNVDENTLYENIIEDYLNNLSTIYFVTGEGVSVEIFVGSTNEPADPDAVGYIAINGITSDYKENGGELDFYEKDICCGNVNLYDMVPEVLAEMEWKCPIKYITQDEYEVTQKKMQEKFEKEILKMRNQ